MIPILINDPRISFYMGAYIESDIIKACRAQDRKAQNLLFNRYAPLMLSICKRYLKTIELAEDIMVHSFHKIFSKINTFKDVGSFEGWMKRIVVNECLMELRKKKNHYLTVSLDEMHNDPLVEWDNRLEYEEILQLLDHLPVGYRTVFNLYVIVGYKHREIAEQLGVSINTSKSQLILARRKLQAIIKKKYEIRLSA